jgi:hypothetical protein
MNFYQYFTYFLNSLGKIRYRRSPYNVAENRENMCSEIHRLHNKITRIFASIFYIFVNFHSFCLHLLPDLAEIWQNSCMQSLLSFV